MNHYEKAIEHAALAERSDLTADRRGMHADLARMHLEMHRVEKLDALEARLTEIEKALA